MSSRYDNPEPRRLLRVIGVVLLVFAIVQSITITPSIHGRVVDEQTGEPLQGASIAALWKLEVLTLVDSSLPGGPLKVAETTTDRNGEFAFPTAVLIHWPVAPFSLLTRSPAHMPMLIVAQPEYQTRTMSNDLFGFEGPSHGDGFLSLRSSSLENAIVRLPRWTANADSQTEDRRSLALDQLQQAAAECSRRWLCQEQPLLRTREMLKQLGSRP